MRKYVVPVAMLAFLSISAVSIAADAAAGGQKATLTTSAQPAGTLDQSLANEARASIDRSVEWLCAQQKEDGSFSDGSFPALTGLALQAIVKSGRTDKKDAAAKAVAYIKSCVQKDGGIYKEVPGRKGGGLSNYNTAICMVALYDTGDASLTKIVQDARKFVAGSQYLGDDVYKGGFGYDKQTQRAYTDLLNTYYAADAMKQTAGAEDSRPKDEKKVDIDWNETVKFIEKMQNKPESGDDSGGMFYNPTDPKAGATTNKEGVVVFRSYGSITYAGMLALIHANITRDDVRVKSAFDWAMKHWSLEENPGMGANGQYFFYNVLTKCLSAYGQPLVPVKDQQVNWKADVAKKMISLQKRDEKNSALGFWKNDIDRYWEGDPVLVTAYSLMALEAAAK